MLNCLFIGNFFIHSFLNLSSIKENHRITRFQIERKYKTKVYLIPLTPKASSLEFHAVSCCARLSILKLWRIFAKSYFIKDAKIKPFINIQALFELSSCLFLFVYNFVLRFLFPYLSQFLFTFFQSQWKTNNLKN